MLMVIEKTDPDLPQPTAARVRIMLDPLQVAGLDSEEGRSLNLTCGEGAATLAVDCRRLRRKRSTGGAARPCGDEDDLRAGRALS
jgi:hypothetical protein